jgi:hypothetical protein
VAATKEQKRAYYERNRQKVIDASAAWRRDNPEKYAAQRRPHNAKRRAAKLDRTPPWSDLDEVSLIYKQAASLQRLLGRPIHVDHMVPLRGEAVSGLHVPENLQITFAEHNLAKSNTHSIAA